MVKPSRASTATRVNFILLYGLTCVLLIAGTYFFIVGTNDMREVQRKVLADEAENKVGGTIYGSSSFLVYADTKQAYDRIANGALYVSWGLFMATLLGNSRHIQQIRKKLEEQKLEIEQLKHALQHKPQE
jgi:hypothetical protein